MLSKQHFAPLLCYNVLLAVYGTLLMTIIPASESNSESKIEILSLLPFISCPHDSSPGRNESLNITFLRNYHLPNSLCDLSKAVKQGLDDAAADFNLLDEANTITISHEQTQVRTFGIPPLALKIRWKYEHKLTAHCMDLSRYQKTREFYIKFINFSEKIFRVFFALFGTFLLQQYTKNIAVPFSPFDDFFSIFYEVLMKRRAQLLQWLVFSRRCSIENCPTITVARFFRQTTDLTLYVPLVVHRAFLPKVLST